jgi:hypothetical protein
MMFRSTTVHFGVENTEEDDRIVLFMLLASSPDPKQAATLRFPQGLPVQLHGHNLSSSSSRSSSVSSSSSSSSSASSTSAQIIGNHSHSSTSMQDSTAEYKAGDWVELRKRFDDMGYLFVQGVFPHAVIQNANRAVLENLKLNGALRRKEPSDYDKGVIGTQGDQYLQTKGGLGVVRSTKLVDGVVVDVESGVIAKDPEAAKKSHKSWTHFQDNSALTGVSNHSRLAELCHRLFENDANDVGRLSLVENSISPCRLIPDTTWCRSIGSGGKTAAHVDSYFFQRNTQILGDHWESIDPLTTECPKCHESTTKSFSSSTKCALCKYTFHDACLDPTPIGTHDSDPTGQYFCPSCANKPFPFHTVWVPLTDLASKDSRLAVIPRSHKVFAGYHKPIRLKDEDLVRERKH